MGYQPGVLPHPENGVILVFESHVYHLKEQNDDYEYEKYPVTPSPPIRLGLTMFIPDWMTSC